MARSTFYYHQARLGQVDKHGDLRTKIKAVFDESRGRYGHRRIRLALQREGLMVSRKLVAKLMKREGLTCLIRKKKRYNSYRGTLSTIAPNVLARDFTASGPNQKWVSDVTEFRLGQSKIYLSPIIDLFDHSIVSYTVGTSPNLTLTNTSLRQALNSTKPRRGLVVHTDQGFQYQHYTWRQQLNRFHAIQSMSRKANCYDNAIAENFFSHLKSEMFYPNTFTSPEHLITEIKTYIHWYNNKRIQERLEGMTPNEYRNHALAA